MKENNKNSFVFGECVRLLVVSTVMAVGVNVFFAKEPMNIGTNLGGGSTVDGLVGGNEVAIKEEEEQPAIGTIKLNYETDSPNSTDDKLMLPEVMLIGTQKSGTSALALLLYDVIGACRPEVFEGEPYYFDKECHFFDISPRYREGPAFYAKRYEHCKTDNNMLVLDATPGYFVQAERIHATYAEAESNFPLTNPNIKNEVKFIAVLREPISRELSVYNHKAWLWVRKPFPQQWYSDIAKPDGTVKSFTEYALESTIPNITTFDESKKHGASNYHLGLYSHHLRQWFKYFDRSQILLLSHEELKRSPHTVRDRIVDFLGIEHTDVIDNYEFPMENAKESDEKVYVVPCSAKQHLSEHFDPLNEELYSLLEEYSTNRPPMEQYPFPRFVAPNCA